MYFICNCECVSFVQIFIRNIYLWGGVGVSLFIQSMSTNYIPIAETLEHVKH